jgi:hypothetical protein
MIDNIKDTEATFFNQLFRYFNGNLLKEILDQVPPEYIEKYKKIIFNQIVTHESYTPLDSSFPSGLNLSKEEKLQIYKRAINYDIQHIRRLNLDETSNIFKDNTFKEEILQKLTKLVKENDSIRQLSRISNILEHILSFLDEKTKISLINNFYEEILNKNNSIIYLQDVFFDCIQRVKSYLSPENINKIKKECERYITSSIFSFSTEIGEKIYSFFTNDPFLKELLNKNIENIKSQAKNFFAPENVNMLYVFMSLINKFTKHYHNIIKELYVQTTISDPISFNTNVLRTINPSSLAVLTEIFEKCNNPLDIRYFFYVVPGYIINSLPGSIIYKIAQSLISLQEHTKQIDRIKQQSTYVASYISDILQDKKPYGYQDNIYQEQSPPKISLNWYQLVKLATAIQFSEMDQDQAYDQFRNSYEKATGKAWDKNRFLDKASGWIFYGDKNGYVSVRPQRSGLLKLVGVAGNPKSIVKGVQELLAESKPVWGLVSLNIASMAEKLGFKAMKGLKAGLIMKLLFSQIPSNVLGNAKINNIGYDGAINLEYSDIGMTTKYLIFNSAYINWALTQTHIPETAKSLLKKLL